MTTENERAVLLGMNNPLSSMEKYALWPDPPGSTGWRLWKMLENRCGASAEQYAAGFERVNAVVGPWSRDAARRRLFGDTETFSSNGEGLVAGWRGRTVVVLGAELRRVLCLSGQLVLPQKLYGVTWRCVPHPSGLCQWYNTKANRELVSLMLEELWTSNKEED